MKYCDHKLIPSKEIIGDKVCTKCKKSFRSLKRNRLSMKLLWQYAINFPAFQLKQEVKGYIPPSEIPSFLNYVEEQLKKPLKP